jgi:dTDP-4-amino-4,6-dideoxygalactose transaminase
MVSEDSYDRLQAFKKEFLKQNHEAEELLDEDRNICTMSKYAVCLWNKADMVSDMKKRAENAVCLYQELCGLIWLSVPLGYHGMESPLYVAICLKEAQDRAGLQSYLQQHEVYAPVLWPVSERILNVQEDTLYLYEHLLALPCDQRYDIEDMKRIADLIKGWR